MNNQIKKINLNHSFVFFLFCNIFSLIAFKISYFTISPLICLFLILSIGVSHGSLDNLKGKKLFQIYGINNFVIFYFSYILISLSVIFFWIIVPSISLIIFLIIASHHFGKEDTQFLIIKNSYFNHFLFFLKGSLIIFAPLYFHFEETVSIFKLLLIDDETFYKFLNLIETNKILLYCIILSTLSSIILFAQNFEFKKFTIFLDYFSILIIIIFPLKIIYFRHCPLPFFVFAQHVPQFLSICIIASKIQVALQVPYGKKATLADSANKLCV